jgi:hypothetical protein
MKRPIIAVAALGVVLSWLLYASGRSGSAQPATAMGVVAAPAAHPDDNGAAVAELSRKVALLQGELNAVKQTKAATVPPKPAEQEGTESETSKLPEPDFAHMSHEQIRAYEHEESTKLAAKVDAKLQSESPDPTWSPKTERAMTDAFSALALKGTRFESAECRNSLCKMVVGHDGLDTVRTLSTTLLRRPPFDGMGTFLHYDDSQAIVYVVRPGYEDQRF